MLLKEIYKLEQLHKRKVGSDTQQALVSKQDEMIALTEQETKQALYTVAKERYQWKNKS